TLVAGIAGALLCARRPITADPELARRTRPGALLCANLLAPLLVLNLPDAPIFGGVKHFLAAMPFLALLAALTLTRLGRRAAAARRGSGGRGGAGGAGARAGGGRAGAGRFRAGRGRHLVRPSRRTVLLQRHRRRLCRRRRSRHEPPVLGVFAARPVRLDEP